MRFTPLCSMSPTWRQGRKPTCELGPRACPKLLSIWEANHGVHTPTHSLPDRRLSWANCTISSHVFQIIIQVSIANNVAVAFSAISLGWRGIRVGLNNGKKENVLAFDSWLDYSLKMTRMTVSSRNMILFDEEKILVKLICLHIISWPYCIKIWL